MKDVLRACFHDSHCCLLIVSRWISFLGLLVCWNKHLWNHLKGLQHHYKTTLRHHQKLKTLISTKSLQITKKTLEKPKRPLQNHSFHEKKKTQKTKQTSHRRRRPSVRPPRRLGDPLPPLRLRGGPSSFNWGLFERNCNLVGGGL